MFPALPPVLAVIQVDFDPLLRLGELTIRWQTIGVTLAILAALALAALTASSLPSLRPGDMVLVVGGMVPGAVIGGRMVHVLVFWDAYAATPVSILDPSVGSLSLLGAVLGGFVSGAYVARVLDAPIRRWADAAAVPLLLAIALGKIAQFLGGSGQGLPFDGPLAVAFVGAGPWVSANPEVPSHPSQMLEALWMLIGIPLVLLRAWLDRSAERSGAQGGLFVGALSWFLAGRVLIGFTWRDEATVGLLNAEQALALTSLAAVALIVALGYARYRGRERKQRQERAR